MVSIWKGSNVRVNRVNVYGCGNSGINADLGIFSECNCSFNAVYGIAATGGKIQNNYVTSNGYYGIYVPQSSIISGNHAVQNGANGIQAANSLIENNNAYGNVGVGIAGNYNRIINNSCQENGFGILGGSENTIESNSLYGNHTGLYIVGGSNYFANNKASGSTLNYSTTGGGTAGTGDNVNISY